MGDRDEIFSGGVGNYSGGRVDIFSVGVAIFLGVVEIFSGAGVDIFSEGVEIFSEGLRLYTGGVEIIFGEGGGGLRHFQGVCEIFRGVK